MRKPISPLMHGIIDYVFSAALLTVPKMIKLKKKAVELYAVNGLTTAAYSAATNYPVGLKPIIPFKTHGEIECANIALLALATTNKHILKDKRALAFHVSILTAAILTASLTDWNKL